MRRSLEWTRQPFAFNARLTLAVPANATPLQGAEYERKKSGFVSDVPHDAKRARLLASPSETVSGRYYGQVVVNTVCGFEGMAKPYAVLSASAAAFAIS